MFAPHPRHRERFALARVARLLSFAWLLLIAPMALAAGVEIHSNGRGGGPWSDAETWHGKRVPGPDDIAVIAMRDEVTFDRDDRDQPTCRELYLDPESVLSFEEGRERRTLSVAGPVELYGTIRIDGTGDRRGSYELRLVGADEAKRTIRLMPNASLLAYGNEEHREGERNVRITAGSLDASATATVPAQLVADGKAMVDLQRTHVQDLAVKLTRLDNTSARPQERLNVIGSLFTGNASLSLTRCDTPTVRDNTFKTESPTPPEYAINLDGNALAQLRGNKFTGPYANAIMVVNDNNSSIVQTEITGAKRGMQLGGENIVVTAANLTDCERGIRLYHARTVVKDVTVRGALLAYQVERSTAQIVNSSAPDPRLPDKAPAGKTPVVLNALWFPSLLLIDVPIEPNQVSADGSPEGKQPFVSTMQKLVVKVSPKPGATLPAGLRVHLETAPKSGGVPKGRTDLNVRNSPAEVSPEDGMTPPKSSEQVLTLRSWHIDADKKVQPAPSYKLMVQVPAPSGDGAYKTLVEQMIEPTADWFRSDANGAGHTLEVTLP